MIARMTLAAALLALGGTACAGSTEHRAAQTGATSDSNVSSDSRSDTEKRSCDGLSASEKAQCLRGEKGSASSGKGMDAASGRNAGYGASPSSNSSGGAASEGGGGGGGDSSGSGSGH